ncbi:cadherin-like beta sandwich domain-containing protein, partial [uncultured Mucilaginibacter sp.]|uniref:cadherin-like beta sandwich domain-containing protein n=1 Tax=uncultured Mucilaginibacter sp. TaxID=797541 RepID=UPI0025FA9186
AGLSISNGTLTPVFAAGSFSYTAVVAYAIGSLKITPTVSNATATVSVNGSPVQSGMPSSDIILSVGHNTVTTTVTAQDGVTTKTYAVVITRAAPSTNAGLSGLAISNGTLTPVFAPGRVAYTATVPYTVGSLTLAPTASDATATITVNGAAVLSGTASSGIGLSVGTNTITTTVMAQDGITTKTYAVVITRTAAATNAGLAGLALSVGTLAPVFATTKTSYVANVANSVNSIAFTPTLSDSNATVMVNNMQVKSGMLSSAVPLNAGANTINIVTLAQDRISTKTYAVTVNRAKSSNANLISLLLSSGALSPVFAATTMGYTANIANAVTAITLTPSAADTNATITVNNLFAKSGMASVPISLPVGTDTILIKTTAQNGTTSKTYTLIITRAMPSANSVYVSVSVATPTEGLLLPDLVSVHQAISPNGDGVNDFLMIDGIGAYPDNRLRIMNKNGEVIFEKYGYNNSAGIFDGHSNKNGTRQMSGTYFYEFEYKAAGIVKRKSGFLILKW